MTNSATPTDANRDGGPLTAVVALSEISDPIEAAAAYRQAIRDAYWNERDVAQVITLAHAGFGAALAAAARAADAETAYALRSEAKAMCYDLASFTWSGWGEPDLSISLDQEAVGLEAARENLRLARGLDKGALPISRALWMLGAHLAAARDYQDATDRLNEAAAAAREAEAEDEAALADAFVALVGVLAGYAKSEQLLEEQMVALRTFEGGEGLAGQVTTAHTALDR